MPENEPSELRQYRNRHAGETILVCGCGPSVTGIKAPDRYVTIGVNDAGRWFDPDYLVVLNSSRQFTGDRFRYVAESRAEAVFSQLNLGIPHPKQVRFRLGQRGGTDVSNPDSLPHARNSPYVAVCLAMYMGSRRIGLIGVDLADAHHPLTREVAQIDLEYGRLRESCAARGIEIFNLSRESRLKSLPKAPIDGFWPQDADRRFAGRRVFFVNYRFLSCGTVFRDGLAHAAEAMGLEWKAADWDDASLEDTLAEFRPELIFVVHGRKFCSRRLRIPAESKSAVWLLDEPYEVDDTSRFSSRFDAVFVNDESSLPRHSKAHPLPVCYDPQVHTWVAGEERARDVGFIGGANPRREEILSRLARRGMLSYVVGGPWRDAGLNRLCLAGNIAAGETAALYRQTKVVVNVFRSQHHYNASGLPATSMNPRIYEALACGALVISEDRPEMDAVCPELPRFRSLDELDDLIGLYLNDPHEYARVRKVCARRLAGHTYAQRLAQALATTLCGETRVATGFRTEAAPPPIRETAMHDAGMSEWKVDESVVRREDDGTLVLTRPRGDEGGSESGLAGTIRYGDVALEFEALISPDSCLVAKLHQESAEDQTTNSYHLMCRGARGYLARHDHVLQRLAVPVGRWFQVICSWRDGVIVLRFNGVEMARRTDQTLREGYCFVGVKGGEARVRNLQVSAPASPRLAKNPEYELLRSHPRKRRPMVSIVTTVYDRVECLERCIRSVQALRFRDYEQIIVADRAPDGVLNSIASVTRELEYEGQPAMFAVLRSRRNDWGMTPAAAGLSLAAGKYVCFLSDDNGYLPTHFDRLVSELERDPGLGFVYSSCQYDGRLILNASRPQAGRIDLGQPLFRRDLFEKHLGGGLPFHEFGWDWRMIESFMKKGVRWKHVDEPTFLFRLARYPHLMAPEPAARIA